MKGLRITKSVKETKFQVVLGKMNQKKEISRRDNSQNI